LIAAPAFTGITRRQWHALFAAQAGYMLDATDVLLYVFALNTLRAEFGLSNAQAGLVSSVTLVTSAIGGVLFGILSDRVGRMRTLVYTILLYSIASAGTALSSSLGSLLFWRALIGLGLGGEWSAGALLVAETWPAEHRAKATGFMQSGWALGYILAAGVTAVVLPRFGWRVLFLTGLAPAALAWAIRRNVPETEIWRAGKAARKTGRFSDLFRPPLARRTAIALALSTSVLFAYWGLFTWLPGFLSASRETGGAGLSIVRTSGWIVPMQIGAFFGYVTFGLIADKFGRRPAFLLYMLTAAALVPVYGWIPRLGGDTAETVLLALGPLIGFFGSGYFALFGVMLAELYPTSVRGTGHGFTFNVARGLSALAPFAVGFLADRHGVGAALALNSAFFLTAASLIFLLPETRRVSLD
jgi:MFS family permease